MENQDILLRIQALVEEEHQLRGTDPGSAAAEHSTDTSDASGNIRLRHVEAELDQYWDLLRQRRAKSQAGGDPDDASVRSVNDVESYRQ